MALRTKRTLLHRVPKPAGRHEAQAIGVTEYGGKYASTVQSGSVFGTQYHPEKSGPVGLAMLANFCRLGRKT